MCPVANNSFYGTYNDLITLHIYKMSAFIDGNDTICNNAKISAQVKVYFNNAVAPYTFSYAINGIVQPSITTSINPYIINTKQEGNYTLTSFTDANSTGTINGSAMVTVLTSPIANFEAQPDSMTILFTTSQLIDKSEGNIVSWQWDFGDNTPPDFSENPYHTYSDSLAMYQVSLIIQDGNGCIDTTFKHIQITDDYWIYIPNSFTPDLDGINDKFCISHHGIREETFVFNVYSRFSELVYSTDNIHDLDCNNGWDGKHQSSGEELPLGAYIYEIYYQDFEGWKHQESSEIILIR